MYVMQLTTMPHAPKPLTCCLLVYALVPHILTKIVTPVDDICIFTYPLHCGQPFMEEGANVNEAMHEVPFYIYILLLLHMFHTIVTTYDSSPLLSFHHPPTPVSVATRSSI
jgi:hypothetical protein